jgi:hypothetical protein
VKKQWLNQGTAKKQNRSGWVLKIGIDGLKKERGLEKHYEVCVMRNVMKDVMAEDSGLTHRQNRPPVEPTRTLHPSQTSAASESESRTMTVRDGR